MSTEQKTNFENEELKNDDRHNLERMRSNFHEEDILIGTSDEQIVLTQLEDDVQETKILQQELDWLASQIGPEKLLEFLEEKMNECKVNNPEIYNRLSGNYISIKSQIEIQINDGFTREAMEEFDPENFEAIIRGERKTMDEETKKLFEEYKNIIRSNYYDIFRLLNAMDEETKKQELAPIIAQINELIPNNNFNIRLIETVKSGNDSSKKLIILIRDLSKIDLFNQHEIGNQDIKSIIEKAADMIKHNISQQSNTSSNFAYMEKTELAIPINENGDSQKTLGKRLWSLKNWGKKGVQPNHYRPIFVKLELDTDTDAYILADVLSHSDYDELIDKKGTYYFK